MIYENTIYDGKFYTQFVKLLAQENIKRTVEDADTAYFDLNTRTIIIPTWHETLSEPVRKLLHSHEVGHAIYTPVSDWHRQVKKLKLHLYLNVVEDTRIDVLMCHKYRGLRPIYKQGYRELFENYFFNKTSIDKYTKDPYFINRFNLISKLGWDYGIPVNNETEQSLLDESLKLKTFKDVVGLAKKLIAYDKSIKDSTPIEDSKLLKSAGGDAETFQDFVESLSSQDIEELEKISEGICEKDFDDELKSNIKASDKILNQKDIFADSPNIIPMEKLFEKFDNYMKVNANKPRRI